MASEDGLETIIRPAVRRAAEPRPFEALAAAFPRLRELGGGDIARGLEALIAEIDGLFDAQLRQILHHPDFQQIEATWRALHMLVSNIETGPLLKVRAFDIGKRELQRSLRKFRGAAWDDSPLFRHIYEQEYGQLGGEPFALLLGDYSFDNRPEDVQLLADLAQIAAAAHAPFVAAAAPALLGMDDWSELADRRDPTRVLQLPEYAAWRALRESEDSRYLGLCLPRFLVRLPFGAGTDPQDRLDFEEGGERADRSGFLWANASWLFGIVVARAFTRYGWCVRITGREDGGRIDDLPVLRFDTADGDADRRCCVEIAISERREAELSRQGLMTLLHVKGSNEVAFTSAPSLQRPASYADPAASLNASVSAKLPYMFACARFAHHLKCMVRDKIGGGMGREQLQSWLGDWLQRYVDDTPATSSDDWKATHPLAEAGITLERREDLPGHYRATFFVRPHFQLEGATASLRLVTRLAAL